MAKKSTKKYINFMYEDGRTTDTAYFDGYEIGDRLLEGVPFKVIINKGKPEVSFAKIDSYIEDLNQKKWLKSAKDYLKEYDEQQFYENSDLSGEFLELNYE